MTADREIRHLIRRENTYALQAPEVPSQILPRSWSSDVVMLGFIDPCPGLVAFYLLLVELAIGCFRLLGHLLHRGPLAVLQMDSTTLLEMAEGRPELRPRRLWTRGLPVVSGLASIGVIWLIIGLILQKNPAATGWLDTLKSVLDMLMVLGIITGAMSQPIPRLRSRVVRIDGTTGTITVVRGAAGERIAAPRVTDVRVGESPGRGLKYLNAMFGSVRCEIAPVFDHRESLLLGPVSARPDRAREQAHAISVMVDGLVRLYTGWRTSRV